MTRHRRAKPIRTQDRVILWILIAVGVESVIYFSTWWFKPHNVNIFILFLGLSICTWYGISRIMVGWYNYLHIKQPPPVEAPPGLSVAVLTTSSPGEPLEMFRETLSAINKIRYPHQTYLLDDTRDYRFKKLAEELNINYMEILDEPGAKAGKINYALKRIDAEFILILDPDHVPFPEFLDRVLGYFNDPKVGFVQVAQAYYNQDRSFVARGAAEQTYNFYGPIMMGMYGLGVSVAIGANCTFRREALLSIGGHGVGLAEDLITAIKLHSKGWKSVYVPEIVARGLVPEDLGSYYKQQLKWARGVYEVLFKYYPRCFKGLTWYQRLSYLMIGTYYLMGIATLGYIVIPFVYLWTGAQPAAMDIIEYIQHALPVGIMATAIYLYVQRWLCHPEMERGIHWRGMLLKLGTWHIYALGLFYALTGVNVPYIPTPKEAHRGSFWRLAWVHVTIVSFFTVTALLTAIERLWYASEAYVFLSSRYVWGMMGFAFINALFMSGGIYGAYETAQTGIKKAFIGFKRKIFDQPAFDTNL